jgi:thioredoxin 1
MNLEILNPDTIIRAFWALGIIAAGALFYWLLNSAILLRTRVRAAGIDLSIDGTPTLLYFTTPDCAPCRTIQRPAIQRLQEIIGDSVKVVEVDASAQPEIASRWGVLSVPTTFVIDTNGEARHVNHGVTSTETLMRQINAVKPATRR